MPLGRFLISGIVWLPAQFDFANVAAGKDRSLPRMVEVRLDLDSGKATSHIISEVHCEFPTIPDSLVGAQPLSVPGVNN